MASSSVQATEVPAARAVCTTSLNSKRSAWPVAWVDTAGRVPLLRRRSGAFKIEYAAGYLLKRDLARLPQGSPQSV